MNAYFYVGQQCMNSTTLFIFLCCLFPFSSTAYDGFSPPKELSALRANEVIKIDGQLDDPVWLTAPVASDFTQLEPIPDLVPSQKSEVRILYDDKAIYIGATLYDTEPDSILKQLSQRDDLGNTDWFSIYIDAYQDGLNGLGFLVTAAGVQVDRKFSAGGQNGGGFGSYSSGDTNWNAVWKSEVRITENGWIIEMEIPYSALRFPNISVQNWNINFGRQVRRKREVSFWNRIDPTKDGFFNQSGKLNGIKEITSPVRLAATPFFSTYFENYRDKESDPVSSWGRSFNGGMDIKYGINDAFTLDMTLIPDFGQVQSDNQVLNLSPFEVRFDENRQFFTEGTELFNKGGLFYSRRVGGVPLGFYDVEYDEDSEELIENPIAPQLYNATKISGRTTNGLGVGFFNATSAKTEAIIENIGTGDRRKVATNPLTNYNVLVFDQNLKNNSYLSLINTNVLRNGHEYDANSTGTEFLFRNKANSYSIKGNGVISQQYFSDVDNIIGHAGGIEFSKTSGALTGNVGYYQESEKYDINDLGFLFNNNSRIFYADLNHNNYKPVGIFNRIGKGFYINYERLYKPNKYSEFNTGYNMFFITKAFNAFGINLNARPVDTYDYFEPRTDDFRIAYKMPKGVNLNGWISTDYRKQFAFDVNLGYTLIDETERSFFNYRIAPRFRVNDKLNFVLSHRNQFMNNDVGFVYADESSDGHDVLHEDDILMGRRDQNIINNTLSVNYTFNNKMGLTFRARHYWTEVAYKYFNTLNQDGTLLLSNYKGNDESGTLHDTNFNIFNIDLVYTWRFAPGSDIIAVWKNSISDSNNNLTDDYFGNLNQLTDLPQTNSFSIKVIYYLDYLMF